MILILTAPPGAFLFSERTNTDVHALKAQATVIPFRAYFSFFRKNAASSLEQGIKITPSAMRAVPERKTKTTVRVIKIKIKQYRKKYF